MGGQGVRDEGPRPDAGASPQGPAPLAEPGSDPTGLTPDRQSRQSATTAKTRKLARSRGSSWNSGLRQPSSSSRLVYVSTTSTSHIGSDALRARTAPKPPRVDSAASRSS